MLLLSFLGAAIGYVLASGAVALGSVSLLLLSRLPVGLAKQTVTATRAIVCDLTPPDESRSEWLARLWAGCSLGYAVGPWAGGRLLDAVGAGGLAPLPSALCAGVFLLLIPFVAKSLPETRQADSVACAPTPAGGAPASSTSADVDTTRDGIVALCERILAALGSRGASADDAPDSSTHADDAPLKAWTTLLVGLMLPEGAFVLFGSTMLALRSHSMNWSATQLGAYTSLWGLGGSVLSMAVWPRLYRSGVLDDHGASAVRKENAATASTRPLAGALRTGVVCLGLASLVLASDPGETAFWCVLPLGVVCVGLLRTAPAALMSKRVPATSRGRALARLDAGSSACRVLLPPAAGRLVDEFGQPCAFLFIATLCAVGLLLVEAALPRSTKIKGA